jgi:hypothetical protein
VNVYHYDEETTADIALNAPFNSNSGSNYGLSFVTFCFDYELEAVMTTDPSFDRTWDWSLVKTSDAVGPLELADGQLYPVNYTITTTTEPMDENFEITGTVTITNPAPMPATITAVNTVLEDTTVANVDCGVTFPYVLASLGELDCTYSATVGDITDQEVTTTIETSGDVDGDVVSAEALFEGPTSEFDECITVNDTNANGPQNVEVCADDVVKTFSYEVMFGKNTAADIQLICGANEYINTATIATNDNVIEKESSVSVTANIDCPQGCTLTQGYWKTHSSQGPAPYDDAWLNNESRTLRSMNWLTILHTSPQKGNAWYILAHQYIAAWMNYNANGADAPTNVISALNGAGLLLSTNSPETLAAAKGKSGTDLRNNFINLAGLLGSYNEGTIGPGHCSE